MTYPLNNQNSIDGISKTISLTQDNLKKLEVLAEMINTGSDEFLSEIELDKLSLKQELLYINFAVVNSYSEAIFKLCSDLRPFPANVLLRSIIESFINTAYILTHNSDKRALLFSLDDSYYRKGLGNEIITFLKKYPKFQKENFNIEIFEQGLNKIDEEIEMYKSKFGLVFSNKKEFERAYPSLIERAKAVDRRIGKPNFEHTYILVYRYLSEFGHLSMRGLDHFIKRDSGGNHEILASQHSDVDPVISMTYTIYLFFLDQLKKRKLLRKDFPLGKFNKYWKDIFNPASKPINRS